MMSMKCLIVDDEPLAINVIKVYLQEVNDIDIAGTFSNAIEALDFLRENRVDLIFLDINMPLLDGLNFIKSLDTKPIIIITSAYEEYAIKTYELDVLDYLVKPIPFPRFLKAVNKALKVFNSHKSSQSTSNNRAYVFIKVDKKKMKKVYLDEILVIESLKDYLKITTQTNRYIIHSTLSNFTEQLPESEFIRIHRSCTVAIDKIDTLEGNSVEIEDIRYTIGRTYIEEVKKKILNSSF